MADLLNIYQVCPGCDGSGTVTRYIESSFGEPAIPQIVTCPKCSGTKDVYWGQMREVSL